MTISTTKLTKKIGVFLKILLVNGQNAKVLIKVLTTQKQRMAAFKFGTILICSQNIKC